MTLDSNGTQDFDGEFQVFKQTHVGTSDTSSRSLPFIYAWFSTPQSRQHVGYDVRTLLQGVWGGHLICWQELKFQIVGEYDKHVLFPFFVCAYKFLNPIDASEKIHSVAFGSSQSISLYDFMDMDEDLGLLVMKEQLNTFRIKVIREECNNPLSWWKMHEAQFFYVGFLARQFLGIVGSQIGAERVFNNASICKIL
jgi:hypothetical protein